MQPPAPSISFDCAGRTYDRVPPPAPSTPSTAPFAADHPRLAARAVDEPDRAGPIYRL